MKKITLLTAGMLAMLAINSVSAQVGGTLPDVELRYTGSTAFRKATVNSIQNSLQAGYVWGSTSGSGGGASQQIFVGTTVPIPPATTGYNVVIKTAWSGSAGGIQSVDQNINAAIAYVNDSLTSVSSYGSSSAATVNGIPLSTGGANIPTSDITEAAQADIALSDAFQSTTPYTDNTNLFDTVVGVVPFAWIKGEYTPDGTVGSTVAGGVAGMTNITETQAQALLSGGIALNQFTGDITQQSIIVKMVGRDHDSGTRIGYIYDTQYGNFESAVDQFLPQPGGVCGPTEFDTQSAGTGVITSLIPWQQTNSSGTPFSPARTETVLGETRATGNEGYYSGGTVASVLVRPASFAVSTHKFYLVSSLGFGDSPNVNPFPVGPGQYSYTDGAGNISTIKPSQNAILYNGYYPGTAAHPFGPPYTNIDQGIYESWGYEHYLYDTTRLTSGSTGQIVADQISAQLTTEADFAGVGELLSRMHASRGSDGSPITSP
jgi:hypothetical protein